MQTVPVQAVPSQTLTIQLGGQNVQLNVYQQAYGLFMDVYVNNTLIIGGVVCKNLIRIVRNSYLGFIGDFVWYDTTNQNEDPVYTGLGAQWLLVYLEAADVPADAIA
jgi:hypothetical protein